MEAKGKTSFYRIITLVTFILMIVINVSANLIPINGVTTGEVSEFYENLFAPAGYTFAIWGLIYLLLAAYVLYQFGIFGGNNRSANNKLIEKISVLFSISSLANTAWILCWHYDMILLSMLMMAIILCCLILINKSINEVPMTVKDKLFIRLPFSIYFGWITVATVANATVLLVSLGWQGFGLSEATWTVIILIVSALIGVITSIINRDIAYGATLVWAYIGILIKHTSVNGFEWAYPQVVITSVICLIFFILSLIYVSAKYTRREID